MKNKIGCAIFGVVAALILVALLLPAISTADGAARRHECTNRLKQLMLALLNYESEYKSFPPAFITDADGKAMHSWRVLILPYLEQRDLYDEYDFNEPWNGPHNRQLADRIDGLFRCPEPSSRPGETSYVAVVGPETGWPGAMPMTIEGIRDGNSKTIALVEVANSGIHWMEPRDMTFAEALKGISPPGSGLTISSNHAGNLAAVGWFDGHVSWIFDDLSTDLLRSLLTAAGGEKFPEAGQ